MPTFKETALSTVAGIGSALAIDVNWTEIGEVVGEVMDLIGIIADKLPTLVIKFAIVGIIVVIISFIGLMLRKVVKFLDMKL